MDPNSPDFKALQAKWYATLKEKGFSDIEQEDGNLKFWASHAFRARHTVTTFEAKEEYYRLAGQFLHHHSFESVVQKQIWALHSEGVSIREIVRRLREKKIKSNTRGVNLVLQRLAKLMVTRDGTR